MDQPTNPPKGDEYIVHLPESLAQKFGVMTRQRYRAAERDMTYSNHGTGNICEFVLISKRTKSKRKRVLKRKEKENAKSS